MKISQTFTVVLRNLREVQNIYSICDTVYWFPNSFLKAFRAEVWNTPFFLIAQITQLASPLKRPVNLSILVLSLNEFFKCTVSLKYWINSSHWYGFPLSIINCMGGRCLDSKSCWNIENGEIVLCFSINLVYWPLISLSIKRSSGSFDTAFKELFL